MYSQNNEEDLIIAELNRMSVNSGRFLDIGAWDGKGFSNTYRLSELGWSGVCVEPSPNAFPSLLKNYATFPSVILVNAAVTKATQGSLVKWHDSGGDAISTTDLAHKTKWETGWKVKYSTFWIYTMPVMALFDQFGFDFDLINIDVEATNWDVFQALPWKAIRNTARIICVEHDNHHAEMSTLASHHGFVVLAINGENLLLSRRGGAF